MRQRSSRRSGSGGFRRGILAILLLLVVMPVGIGMLAVERHPRVADAGPPDAEAAAATRDLGKALRGILDGSAPDRALVVDETDLNGVLASLRRVTPGIAGRATVAGDTVVVNVSAGAPYLSKGWWANLRLALGQSPHGLKVTSARIGRLPLPPALVLPAVRRAADWYLGDGLGTAALAGIAAVRIDPPEVRVELALGDARREALYAALKDRVRDLAGGMDAERIYVHLWWIDHATEAALPLDGTVVPFLRHAVARSMMLGKGTRDSDELGAALLALTLYCGDPDVGVAFGAHVADRMRNGLNRCDSATLAGRDDLKRHFTVSAGLYAASTADTAFGFGELKELLDSNAGGSGFSFDDMAANASGVRFARTFLETPSAEWPALLARVRSEADILPSLDGLPSGLTEAEFRSRYGDVDSPAYKALVAEINARVAALPLYGGEPLN